MAGGISEVALRRELDQYQFILHHEILWQGADVDVAVPLVQKAQARYPALRACSFDRGFHSPDNRVGLDALLDLNALPKKGRLSNVETAQTPFCTAPTASLLLLLLVLQPERTQRRAGRPTGVEIRSVLRDR